MILVYIQAGVDPIVSAETLQDALTAHSGQHIYSVVVANFAFKGLEYLEEMAFDFMAIIQIDMPLLNAREMLSVLRFGGNRIPVFRSLSKSARTGFAGVIPLPFTHTYTHTHTHTHLEVAQRVPAVPLLAVNV
jgi:hypothetical protein